MKSIAFEVNMKLIYSDKYKKIYPSTKHSANLIHLFRDHIYEKDTNSYGAIIIEKIIPRFTYIIH